MITWLASSEARDDPPQYHYTAALKATERKMELHTNSSALLRQADEFGELFVSVIADIAEKAVSRVEEESNGSR
jgi:hypothetical protein